jgi:hypothetical protein
MSIEAKSTELRASRLCSQRDLDEMCRTGVELVYEAVDSGDPGHAADVTLKVQTARAGLGEIFTNWASASLSYVREHHGEQAMTAILDPEQWLALGMSPATTLAEVQLGREALANPNLVADRIADLLRVESAARSKEYWEEVESATLKMHDYRIDWVAEILSRVYRTHGVEGLTGALRHASDQSWWRDRMTMDLQTDPVSRVTEWSFFLGVGNFGTISVTEQDECFVIHHQVCGSCARQELRNRHEPPWSLARVTEAVPGLNFGISDYTIYRTHLAAWHFVMPISQGLPPWPAIDCSGIPGRCWFTIYKDPAETPTRYYEMAGLQRPDQERRSE